MDQAPDQPSSSSPPPEATPALDQRWRGKWLALAIITVVCVGLDQGTKHWAQTDLQHRLTRRVTLVEGYLALSYVRNPGAAWGFLARANKFILYLFRKLEPGQHLMMTALSLVMGGAIGNFIDRIRFNYVVDFIDFHIQRRFKWPTFNVADIAITIGVLLLFLEMFILPRVRRRRQRAASAHAVAAEGEAKDPGEGV
jgi:signal peptidase II